MDWFKSIQKQAQDATNSIMTGEAAARARLLAQQATTQARALAEQATVKAKDIAKEAVEEAEKSLAALRTGSKASTEASTSYDPQQYGITDDLQQFVSSLTYSTFSDYPMATLNMPSQGTQDARLTAWQETHARLILERVKQLQDLRFVLCPKRMNEYTFWMIYFTLCKRYLPGPEQQEQLHAASTAAAAAATAAAMPSSSSTQGGDPMSSAASTSGTAAAGPDMPASTLQSNELQEAGESHRLPTSTLPSGTSTGPGPSKDVAGGIDLVAGSSDVDAASSLDEAELDNLAGLDNDPELDAYLQEALHDDAKGTEEADGDLDDVSDLDDYIRQLDKEVNVD